MDLVLEIDGRSGLATQVYGGLREALRSARLKAGDKLPASRELARQLGVSRNTIIEAYERLVSEGYLLGRIGSGTYVSDHGAIPDGAAIRASMLAPRLSGFARRLGEPGAIVPHRNLPYDFRPGVPELDYFPIDLWRRITARQLRRLSKTVAYYGDPAGDSDLREAIARYIGQSRSVRCGAEDIMITSGSQQALDLAARVLVEPGDMVVMEEPGYPAAMAVFKAAGARVIPVPVDEEGIRVDRMPARARMAYVTPSHQFPLGVPLSLARRRGLLEWARRCGAVIVEDDYDSEFRFAGRPLESLQGLDRDGLVVYLGTFSKVLFPGLRLGYVAAGPALRRHMLAAKWLTDRNTETIEQQAMANFIRDGHFNRYMRKMQRVYGQRRAVLLRALARWAADWLEPLPSLAGLHHAAFAAKFDVETLIARAGQTGVGLYSIAPFYQARPRAGLLFGYGACPSHEIEEGIRRMANVYHSMRAA
ncbi:MAG: PLP-dependent aminotransferase family protein [Candidatus Binataceae bacterium]